MLVVERRVNNDIPPNQNIMIMFVSKILKILELNKTRIKPTDKGSNNKY